ncbi:MAG: hypothetical protein E6Q34_03740 [Burkholderiaceae bacterium]|nr:MAG: hypothetical protein E6Q34_03740 [Burkholderiaceae bacterium]
MTTWDTHSPRRLFPRPLTLGVTVLLFWGFAATASTTPAPQSNQAPAVTNIPQTIEPWLLTPELVIAGAAKKYQKKIEELQQGHLLDRRATSLDYLNRIFLRLQASAYHQYPASANWRWELHTSDELHESSYCMAGGKLLINLPHIEEMNLNEAELAMLISHEMAHALLLHHYLEDQEALRLFPAWSTRPFSEFEDAVDEDDVIIRALAEFNKAQEYEADRAGFQLAMQAGYSAKQLLRFYDKLRKRSAHPNFDSLSHPAPAQRLLRLREMVAQ